MGDQLGTGGTGGPCGLSGFLGPGGRIQRQQRNPGQPWARPDPAGDQKKIISCKNTDIRELLEQLKKYCQRFLFVGHLAHNIFAAFERLNSANYRFVNSSVI